MNGAPENTIPESHETGITGIYHLKRFWYKTLFGRNNEFFTEQEWQKENALLNILGIGLLPAFTFLYEQLPDFTRFEKWIIEKHDGRIPETIITACNALFLPQEEKATTSMADVLTKEDLQFWDEHGYIIVENAVSKEDCTAAREAIWNFLGKQENEPSTWYTPCEGWQGIMVQLFRHPALDKNRASPRIKKAFEQIWGHGNLIVTTDKSGFNPPETEYFTYPGIGLHWDVSLITPVPFGVQGILYLTDTTASQGAFTLIPGFHKKIDQWLLQLPENIHPREIDLGPFGPIPIAANEGDLIIWHHALPHSGSPNKATKPRLVQYIYWHPPVQEARPEWK